jgi:cysteine desulfurase
MSVIYFDNAASTKVDPRVLEAMLPYFSDVYANPSALHSPAQRAKAAVEKARDSVAELLGAADPSEVVFTGCATEANVTVLNAFEGQILFSAIEHPSIRNTALCRGNASTIPVDASGTVIEEEYRNLLEGLRPELVSVMSVNNEIGSVQDVDRLGSLAREHGAYFHSDITQGVGKCKLDLSRRPVDYASFSGHKFHAPKGIGALWVRTGVPLRPFMTGGTHEANRRAGTLSVPSIVGLGEAARIILAEGASESARMRKQRDEIVRGITALVPDCRVNGQVDGAPHIISLSFFRTEGESVIINLDSKGICCTAGAACTSGKHIASPVLSAIGLPEEWLRGTVRVSLSRFTTDEEVRILIDSLASAVREVREIMGYAVSG